ncbi:hypothetical protein C1S82_01630 [Mycolicibacterium cosmeticum]|uniref:Uncharacterized protein n=1 Tax=Mycolicibacterium cosmeticum TaxID=258533 RepID=W9B6V5_MYCCO|nr:hypothetical protein [Mycolicibacterium cosmeticum]TLH81442.1 hypothetical protein C1S82_01630 [Mycolicibacterium cosmeticum]CDO10446.1 hypothetical protein BN977_05279 [Mycolicibacterium cosmeticum]
MIGRLRTIGAFWYGFAIGDDWRVAVGVVAALALTAALSRTTHAPAWPLIVIAVTALLAASVYRAARDRLTHR